MLFKVYKPLFIAASLGIALASCQDDEKVTEPRDNFVGTWSCKEISTNNPSNTNTFDITISKQGSKDSVRIYNFSNSHPSTFANAIVNGTTLTIPTQEYVQNIIINGSGKYASSKINLTYTVDDGQSNPEPYTAECIPKK